MCIRDTERTQTRCWHVRVRMSDAAEEESCSDTEFGRKSRASRGYGSRQRRRARGRGERVRGGREGARRGRGCAGAERVIVRR